MVEFLLQEVCRLVGVSAVGQLCKKIQWRGMLANPTELVALQVKMETQKLIS